MKTNATGRSLIKRAESLELEAYPDPGSDLFKECKAQGKSPYVGGYKAVRGWESISGAPWTIGYGHTGPEVNPGLEITAEEAEDLLTLDLERFEHAVSQMLSRDVSGNQFSAMVSFAYNVGPANLERSTLLRKLNAGDYRGASEEFKRWNKAGGRVLAGLTARRKAERELFLTPDEGE